MKMLHHMSGWSYLRSSFNGKSISDDTSLHAPNKKWRDIIRKEDNIVVSGPHLMGFCRQYGG